MEHMTIDDDHLPTTQTAFIVPTSINNLNLQVDRQISLTSQNNQSCTQTFTADSTATTQSTSECKLMMPEIHSQVHETTSNPSVDVTIDRSNSTVTFQIPPLRSPNQPSIAYSSNITSIQPQVTSNDVQQMLLTFSQIEKLDD